MDELKRIDIQTYRNLPKFPIVLILENIRSMHNIGSIFRTCDSFRVEKINLCGITATPPQNEIRKTALGATESVEWIYYKDTGQCIHELKKDGYLITALEQVEGSIPLHQYRPELKMVKTAIVLGNEVSGIDDSTLLLCDKVIEIPQFGTKHSLNVSVAAGIILWHYFIHLNESY